jgi:hypothetical protein
VTTPVTSGAAIVLARLATGPSCASGQRSVARQATRCMLSWRKLVTQCVELTSRGAVTRRAWVVAKVGGLVLPAVMVLTAIPCLIVVAVLDGLGFGFAGTGRATG